MRPLLSTGVSLAFLMAIGVAACSDTGENTTTTSTPPATEEPAQTGSLPAEEPVPEAPAEEPPPAQ